MILKEAKLDVLTIIEKTVVLRNQKKAPPTFISLGLGLEVWGMLLSVPCLQRSGVGRLFFSELLVFLLFSPLNIFFEKAKEIQTTALSTNHPLKKSQEAKKPAWLNRGTC